MINLKLIAFDLNETVELGGKISLEEALADRGLLRRMGLPVALPLLTKASEGQIGAYVEYLASLKRPVFDPANLSDEDRAVVDRIIKEHIAPFEEGMDSLEKILSAPQEIRGKSLDKIRIIFSYVHTVIESGKRDSGPISKISISPNRRYLASGGGSGVIKIFDLENKTCFEIDGRYPQFVEFSPDSRYLTCRNAENAGKVGLFDRKVKPFLKTKRNGSTCARFSSDWKVLAFFKGSDVWVEELETGKLIYSLKKKDGGHSTDVVKVAFSRDGELLATISNEGIVKVVDLKNKRVVYSDEKVVRDVFDSVSNMDFSPNNRFLAKAGKDGRITIINVETGESNTLDREEGGSPNFIQDFTFSPDSKYLAAGRVLDLETREVVFALDKSNGGHANWVESVDFSPDGKYLASGGIDHKIIIWEMKTKTPVFILDQKNGGHRTWVQSVNFSPDGSFLFSVDLDNIVKIINIWKLIEELEKHNAA